MTTCANCGKRPFERLRRGLCEACYRYEREHGTARPPSLYNRREERPVTMCTHCGNAPVAWKGLCKACYTYRQRTGKMRPKYLHEPIRISSVKGVHCVNCGTVTYTPSKGRCPICYQYRYRHGYDKPRDIIEPLCDCGNPATETMTLAVGGEMVEYQLCRDCADLEREGTP